MPQERQPLVLKCGLNFPPCHPSTKLPFPLGSQSAFLPEYFFSPPLFFRCSHLALGVWEEKGGAGNTQALVIHLYLCLLCFPYSHGSRAGTDPPKEMWAETFNFVLTLE